MGFTGATQSDAPLSMIASLSNQGRWHESIEAALKAFVNGVSAENLATAMFATTCGSFWQCTIYFTYNRV